MPSRARKEQGSCFVMPAGYASCCYDRCAGPMRNPLIDRLRLLTSLSETDLVKLEQACLSTRSFAARTDISPEGDQPTALHIVLDGWAARYKVLPGGKRHISALLLPGDLCDMGGLILQQVHSGVGALGLSAVHVNRALQELRAEGMITLEKRRLTIHDWDALKARADFSPAYLHLEGQRPSSSIVHL